MPVADFVAVALRTLALIATLQAAGLVFYRNAFGADAGASDARIAHRARTAAWFGIAFVLLGTAFAPVRLSGTYSGLFDASLHALLLSSDLGASVSMRVAGLALVVVGSVAMRNRFGITASTVGATLALAASALMGHTANHDYRWLLILLLGFHVLVLAFWFGALSAFLIAIRHEPLAINARLVAAFSAVATWLVPGIFLAGVAIAAVLLADWTALGTPYGRLLVAKTVGFTALIGLASVNKWRFAPALQRGSEMALNGFRRSLKLEWALFATVIALTAGMTTLYSPD